MQPSIERRVQALETRAVNGDDRRISIAVSSEEPVERTFGKETLSHVRGGIDLSFFGSGRAPLLLDHDPTKQVGVVETVTLDERAKKLRAVVRFGQSPLASEVLADVKDGIRLNTSVGYHISDWEQSSEGFIVMKWAAWDAPPPKGARRRLLMLGVAWKWQAGIHGGLTAPVAARFAALEAAFRQTGAVEDAAPGRSGGSQPRPGTRLIRIWRGERHEVQVTGSGYHWRGRDWRSLSAIAREITGCRRNGPRFFGLREGRGP